MSNRAMVKLAFVAGVSLSSLMAPAAVAQAHSAQGMKSYSIAGGDLRSVLKTFAAQSGLRFIFRTRDVQGLRSSGLSGTYTPAQGLQTLLGRTGLSMRPDLSGAIAIVKISDNQQSDQSVGQADQIGGTSDEQDARLRPTANAQTPPVPTRSTEVAADDAGTQAIVVTGSRAAINGFSAPSPTLVVGSELIQQQAATTVAQVLYQEPAIKATRSPGANATNISHPGQAAADLRGLGPQRTLVLVNGARVVPAAPAINGSTPVATDLNLIPTMMIDRVEVVTGGASAQYGSDAISGVVNIMLKRKYSGLEMTAQTGISQYGDNFSYRLGALGGAEFGGGRGHFVASVEYNKMDGMGDNYVRDWGSRDYAIVSNPNFATNGMPANVLAPNVYSNLSAGGKILGPANFSLRNFTFNADGTTRPFDAGSLTNGTTQVGGEGAATSQNINGIPPVKRLTIYARADYEFSDAFQLILEGGYSQSDASLSAAIPRIASATIRRDNAYLPAAVRSTMIAQNIQTFTLSKVFYDQGNAFYEVNNRTPHGLIGAEGDLGGTWRYDLHYSYGENQFRGDVSNNLIAAPLTFALDSVVSGGQIVCRATVPGASFNAAAAGCVPLNPFGPNSSTAGAQAYVNGRGWSESLYKQHSAGINIRAQPFATWAGPISIAFGAEYRHESQLVTADPIAANGLFAGNGNVGTFNGKFDVKEGYAEVIVPLARDMGLAHALDLNAAIRYADYSSIGGQTNWKVGAVYEPIEGLRFRTTRSRDIRAPAIFELNSPGANAATNVSVNGLGGRIPVNATLGNPNLKAERGDTFTAGFVIEPRSLSRLRLSIDYYDINLKDGITSLQGATIGNLCTLGQQQFCDFIRFSGATPVSIVAPVQNIGLLRNKGIDGVLSYTLPVGPEDHTLNIALSGNYVLNALINSGVPGTPSIERAGENGQTNVGSMPRFRGTGSITYRQPEFTITAQGQFVSAGTIDNSYNSTPATTININRVPAIAYLNLYSTFNIAPRMKFTFSVNNVLDQDPPVVPSPNFSTPTNGAYYDKIGRSFQVSVNLQL